MTLNASDVAHGLRPNGKYVSPLSPPETFNEVYFANAKGRGSLKGGPGEVQILLYLEKLDRRVGKRGREKRRPTHTHTLN